MMKILKFAIWAIILLAGVGAAALATVGWQLGLFDQASARVLIGEPMPEFKLKDPGGTEHTLAKYRGKNVVLVFSSFKCPFSKGVDPQLAELAEKHRDAPVVFLAIDSHKDTTVEELRAYAKSAALPFPILKDDANTYADAVGAKRTPEVFIIDTEGKLVYHGAFDDRRMPETPGDTAFAARALDALLAGKPLPVTQTKAWGCTIKRAE